MEANDNKYDQILNYIESGGKHKLSDELMEYLSRLELIRTLHIRFENRDSIVKILQQPPYNLSRYLAMKYYSDAMNLFYLDVKINKEAWRNIIADKLQKAAELVYKTAKSSKDLDIFKNIQLAIFNVLQLDVPEKEDLPEGFFDKRPKLYVIDPKILGKHRADRNELARHIDSLSIPEADKRRIKGDALIEDVDFLEIEENENK